MRRIVPLFGTVLLLAGAVRSADSGFSVMTYNVHQYTLAGRGENGAKDDPKPESEREAILSLLRKERPDVLALQEMGGAPAFAQFRAGLREAGLDYPYAELLEKGRADMNLAVLSRFPFRNVRYHTNDWYSIGEAKLTVLRGFLDVEIEVNPRYRFRMITAHLKSKVYNPLGQTEMRRNEARLLNKVIREILSADSNANLLVVGDLNDDYSSAPLREVGGRRGGELVDLRPADSTGAVWTHFYGANDVYSRFDYIFASRGMLPEAVREQTRVVCDPLAAQASDHRPVMAVFRAVDQ